MSFPVQLWTGSPLGVQTGSQGEASEGAVVGTAPLGRAGGPLTLSSTSRLLNIKQEGVREQAAQTQTAPSPQPPACPHQQEPSARPCQVPGPAAGLENKHVTARPARRTAGAKNRRRL